MASDGRRIPSPRRARLARHLRRLRDEARLTISTAARRAGWSPSKLSRIETSLNGIAPGDVARLLDVYGLTGPRREAMITLAGTSAPPGVPGIAVANHYVELEADASVVLDFEPQYVPGIFQIAEYTRAIFRARDAGISRTRLERAVVLRLARQALLTREDGPRFHFVVDEAALRRPVGGAEVMSAQLSRLAELMVLPSVTVQVLPFEAGEHAGMTGMFAIFDVPDDLDPGVVYLEHSQGGFYLDDGSKVPYYTELFQQLVRLSLEPDASVRMVRRLAAGRARPEGAPWI